MSEQFGPPTGEAFDKEPPSPKIVVDLGHTSIGDIVIDFSVEQLSDELLQKHKIESGLPPSASEQVPNEPHVFDAFPTVEQDGQHYQLGKTKVLAAHGYQRRDPQTQKSVWVFADGRPVADVVSAYNADALAQGTEPIGLLAVCNNDPTAVQDEGIALARFSDVTHAVGSDVKYSLAQEANGQVTMNLATVNPNGHFFIANQVK